jgi:hypothetical protein
MHRVTVEVHGLMGTTEDAIFVIQELLSAGRSFFKTMVLDENDPATAGDIEIRDKCVGIRLQVRPVVE